MPEALSDSLRIIEPSSADEYRRYYELRWKILRAPWNQPPGSEQDELEASCSHFMAIDGRRIITGVGRLQFNTIREAQIRYMAVEKEYEGIGIGRMLVNALEQEARNKNMCTVILDAREPAVGFYQKLGYSIEKQSYVLFDKIQHYRMIKKI